MRSRSEALTRVERAHTARSSGFPGDFHDLGRLNGVQEVAGSNPVGFKGAIIYRPNTLLTFQWRTYTPTGNATLGLGRNNWNLEPGFLFYQRLASRLFLEGQIQDFIPVASADDFAGNVLSYGFALNYLLYNRPYFRVLPVYEMLGWIPLSTPNSAYALVLGR